MPKGSRCLVRFNFVLASFLFSSVFCHNAFGQGFSLLQQKDATSGSVASLGASVAIIGDVDGDGKADFIVGAYYSATVGGLGHNGAAYVYSGATGARIYAMNGSVPDGWFGYSVAGAGDVNGDGIPDFIVGLPAYYPPAYAYVYSGADGSLLYEKALYTNQVGGYEELGSSVAGAGDVNGDGFADFIVADSRDGDFGGSAFVYSGADGALLYQEHGSTNNWGLGYSVAGAGDVNGDGKADFIIGAPGAYFEASTTHAYVYSGTDGSLLYQMSGTYGTRFGFSVAGAGDLNGDGKADFIVGNPLDQFGGNRSGSAFVYSGADGSLLFRKDGTSSGDQLGYSVAGAGDVNRDGHADFIIGAPFTDPAGLADAGSVYLYSGADGNLLFSKDGADGDNLGWSVAGAVAGVEQDVNGDGNPDFILGAPSAHHGPAGTGSAYVYGSPGFVGHQVLLQVSIPLPYQLRMDKYFNKVTIWCNNFSNFDVYDVMLLLKLPPSLQRSDALPPYILPRVLSDSIPGGGVDWQKVTTWDTVDNALVIPVWIYKIRAHGLAGIELIEPGGLPGLIHEFFDFAVEAYSAGGEGGFADEGDFVSIVSRRSSWLYNLICRTYVELRNSGDTLTYYIPTNVFATNVEDWLQNRANQLKITAPAGHLVAACIREIVGVTDTLELRNIAQSVPRVVEELLSTEETASDSSVAVNELLAMRPADVVCKVQAHGLPDPTAPDNGCPLAAPSCPSTPNPQRDPVPNTCIINGASSKNHHQRDCDGCSRKVTRGTDYDEFCYVPHAALDYSAIPGTPVVATVDGQVVAEGCWGESDCGVTTCFGGYGNYGCFVVIRVDVGGGEYYDHIYAHLSDSRIVECGKTVHVGDLIAKSGVTDNEGGTPHVHYEVRHNCGFGTGCETEKVCPSPTPPPICPNDKGRYEKTSASATTEGVISGDPNIKFGPQGFGQNHYLASQNLMPYEIEFENVDTATAAAQAISVADTLNTAAIDPASFRFATIGFGNISLSAADSSTSFSQDVDLRPAKPLLVRVNAQFNSLNGIFTCQLTALDPTTGLPPTDPQLGVLPPNVNPPEGQGWISYTATLRNNLSTGTVISNRAHIVFDNNPSMATRDWVNTIDRSAPTSRIRQAIYNTTDMGIRVSWVGTDSGSGIQNYSVFVDRGFGIEPWLTEVTDTTAIYPVANFQPYCFFVQALDSVGNLEVRNDSVRACATILKGDLNASGDLTPSDVVLMINCVFLGLLPPAAYSGCGINCICDVNCSNTATPTDMVLELYRVFAGSPFPCL